MTPQPLDAVPLWMFFVVECAISLLALEGGLRFGRWRRRSIVEEKEAPVGAMVAAILALFAFLLAFTFGMAASRFEARRQTVLEEANAIGTAYLRTRLLPEPQRGESARLLREYVEVRVRGVQERRVAEAVIRSEALHESLWVQAVQAADKQPVPMTSLYVQALNAVIDTHGVRLQVGLRSRIPIVIWTGLFALAMLAMAAVGYQSGLAVTRRSPAMMALLLAFAGVLLLIADLDRSQEGFLTVSQQAMLDLQAGMEAAKR